MKITREVVEYVAHLGRLDLESHEVDLYTNQLDRILEYIDKLNTLNTEGIEPTGHAMIAQCLLREDVVKDSFDVEESLRNAPERKGNFFKVPPIIELEG
ncbi:MAG TPA: Asp-tRNA(Asn)/Glu-tRNA(Gln) amidotransferase subunit GatC [Syntrophorhabdus sp.]|jgi:aspartyl-tRNA(Asn)/glutamyl-tRNA(Gln) amidotransferase subunit C|nr:Asp-tRNA(Asn)/Glu-tRNA(Gln) amidotransferase subunit GatC [Syntrophorhabdus sp.]MDI9559165.1 Asp-tRNA(Asn)/Glu-tRNA(Gln) amidotransferase subunit GatC [Pseudomonadota bacterium]NMC93526.1 Asp-tRNA(Asn)/Glu-tRNA(Gln) amidotransferase subunit GatC [Syntrophorhabdus sp.]HNS78139.1 Asp-tRNA(Asn)/Glu-tRNA(Gln) amidotransferase subunit GatC [Syntrophorhabdus sp.]HNY69169.1 Asp-tRNA(Asn)/Glu-tRNA(Gln) amidotransferase subunit GatC [Syntrophorhabdus sp.]